MITRRKWLIAGVIAAITLASATYAFTQPERLRHWQVLDIGEYVAIEDESDGKTATDWRSVPLERPESVAAKLNEHYIPAAIQEWNTPGLLEEWRTQVEAFVPGGTEVVVVEAYSTPEKSENVLSVIATATAAVREDHDRIVRMLRKGLVAELIRARNELKQLNAKADQIQSELEAESDRVVVGNEELSNVEGLVLSSVTDIAQIGRDDGNTENSMANIALTSELTEEERSLDELGRTLAVNRKMNRDGVLSAVERLYAVIQSKTSEVDAISARLGNLVGTQSLSEPGRSVSQESIAKAAIVGFGTVLGGILGLLLAVFAEFYRVAQRRPVGDKSIFRARSETGTASASHATSGNELPMERTGT